MSEVYISVLNILNKYGGCESAIFNIFILLDDYTINPVHDKIFDYLFDYLKTKNQFLIAAAKEVCRQQILALATSTNDEQ